MAQQIAPLNIGSDREDLTKDDKDTGTTQRGAIDIVRNHDIATVNIKIRFRAM